MTCRGVYSPDSSSVQAAVDPGRASVVGLLVGLVGHAWSRLLSGQSPAHGRSTVPRGRLTSSHSVTDVAIVPRRPCATRRYSGVLEVGGVAA